jgi:hypothetical protein
MRELVLGLPESRRWPPAGEAKDLKLPAKALASASPRLGWGLNHSGSEGEQADGTDWLCVRQRNLLYRKDFIQPPRPGILAWSIASCPARQWIAPSSATAHA